MIRAVQTSGASFWSKCSEYPHYRTLLLFLALRDITVRYRQTVLGVFWAILQPVLPMLIFTLLFARTMHQQTGGVPYWLFTLAGMIPWMFFSNAVGGSGTTFVNNHGLLNKVYFPRAILPAAAVLACLLDWLIGVVFLVGALFYSGYRPSFEWLFIPVIGLLTALLAAAVGIAAASLAAMYRDVKHILPYLIQLWMYATPVWFTRNMVPRKLQWALGLNPMAGVVEAFRSCLFGTAADWRLLAFSAGATVFLCVIAIFLFERLETDLAELV